MSEFGLTRSVLESGARAKLSRSPLRKVVDAGVSKIERDNILLIEQHGSTFLASSRYRLIASFEADSREGSQKLTNDPEKASVLAHLWADRRYAAMLGLGFSSGIPFLRVYATQSAWLSEAKVPIETIGLMSELTIAYKFKFVWAPFLEKYDAPIFSALLGRRRGWIVVS